MEELSAGCQLQYDVVILFRFGEFDELNDVGVVQLPHDLDLLQNVCPLLRLSVAAGIHRMMSLVESRQLYY